MLTSTIAWPEVAWFLPALVLLLFAVRLSQQALLNYRAISDADVDGSRAQAALLFVIIGVGKLIEGVAAFSVGVVYLALPPTDRAAPVTTLSVATALAFVVILVAATIICIVCERVLAGLLRAIRIEVATAKEGAPDADYPIVGPPIPAESADRAAVID